MTIACLTLLRRATLASTAVISSVAFAATPPLFPALRYDPYAVNGAVVMVEGDVNGDGVNDTVYVSLSSAGPGGSTVTSVLRSMTGGAAVVVAGNSVPCTANSLMLADLNKDNKLDAVVTCAEGSVAVMEGNGDGTFQSASLYPVPSAAKASATDLNGDGFPDLVVATKTGSTASTFAVLLNAGGTGPIKFGTATVYGGATGSTQIMTGDLNGDGKQDVVAGGDPAILSGSSAAIFYGNGDGTFQAASLGGVASKNFTLGDFNGDGVMDVAAIVGDPSNLLSTEVTVRLGGNSTGGVVVFLPVGIVGLHAVDVNGDGHTDLVVTGSTTTILLGDGTGNLSIGRSYATPGDYYGSVKGNNGKTNLVFTTPRGFYTLSGDGTGNFDGLPALIASSVATTADTNGDGLTDLVASEQSLGVQISALGRGDGTFSVLNGLTNQLKGFPVLADFDGDGIVDLVEIYSSGGIYSDQAQGGGSRMVWSKGSGDGRFARNGASIDLAVKGATNAVVGDFDGDGKQDLIVSYLDATAGATNPSGLVLLRGNGDGTFVSPSIPLATSAVTVHGRPLAVDLNGDGKLDIVWGDTAYVNKGDGTFSPLNLAVTGTALAVGDVNGDGVSDVVIDNTIHAGNGDGTFQTTALYTVATPPGSTFLSAAISDVNGDGNADVVVQYMADLAGLSVAYGDGKGNFTADSNVYTTGSKTPVSGTLARLNNQAPALPHDNRMDYVVFADGAAVSLLNQTNPVPAAPAPLPSKLTLSVSPTSAVPLQPVTLSSTVTGLNPTGTVSFTTADGMLLGKEAVGFSVADLQPSFATAGTYTVTAAYSGDSNNAPSVSNPVTVTVAKGPSSTQVRLLQNNVYARRTITLQAFVSGFNPTAPVTFTAGGTLLGTALVTGGIAALRYRFVDPGSYPITASYPGDASNLPSTSSTATLTVVAGPDFSMSISPTTNTVKAGETANYTLTIASVDMYSGVVLVDCHIVSANTGCGLSTLQVPVAANGSPSTVTLSFKTSAPQNNLRPASVSGAVGMGLLMLVWWDRRWRRAGRRLYVSILIGGFAMGLAAVSGCSSSASSSSSAAPSQGTTYSFVLTGSDQSIETSHTVSFQIIVQ